MGSKTVSRQPGEGTALWMLGGLYEVKVSSDESGGSLTVMEMTVPPGLGPPPHTHTGGEVVYVLEGNLVYNVAGEKLEGGPGSVFHVPEGTVENFEAAGDTPLRVLVIYAPGGMDKFFEEAAEPAKARKLPPPPEGPPDIERLARIAAPYGLELKAPN